VDTNALSRVQKPFESRFSHRGGWGEISREEYQEIAARRRLAVEIQPVSGFEWHD